MCPSQLLCKAQSGGVIGKGGMSSLWSVLYLLLSLNCERMAKVTVFFRCCYFYTLVHNIVSMYLHAYVRANKQQSLECPLAKWMVSSRIRILILDFNLSLMTNNYIVETDIWTTNSTILHMQTSSFSWGLTCVE